MSVAGALAIAFLAASCAKSPKTAYAPMSHPVDPLAVLPANAQTVIRVDFDALKNSSVTGPLVRELLSAKPTNNTQVEARNFIEGVQQLVVGIEESREGKDSSVLGVVTGDFGETNLANQADAGAKDGGECRHRHHAIHPMYDSFAVQIGPQLRLYGPCASLRGALDRIDGFAPPTDLDASKQRWREELAFERGAIAAVSLAADYQIDGKDRNLPSDWDRVGFSADFSSGVSARLLVVHTSSEAAQKTLAGFEKARDKGMNSPATRLLGLSDILAATRFRRVADTVTVSLRFTEQEAKSVLQRLRLLIDGLKDTIAAAAENAAESGGADKAPQK